MHTQRRQRRWGAPETQAVGSRAARARTRPVALRDRTRRVEASGEPIEGEGDVAVWIEALHAKLVEHECLDLRNGRMHAERQMSG